LHVKLAQWKQDDLAYANNLDHYPTATDADLNEALVRSVLQKLFDNGQHEDAMRIGVPNTTNNDNILVNVWSTDLPGQVNDQLVRRTLDALIRERQS